MIQLNNNKPLLTLQLQSFTIRNSFTFNNSIKIRSVFAFAHKIFHHKNPFLKLTFSICLCTIPNFIKFHSNITSVVKKKRAFDIYPQRKWCWKKKTREKCLPHSTITFLWFYMQKILFFNTFTQIHTTNFFTVPRYCFPIRSQICGWY